MPCKCTLVGGGLASREYLRSNLTVVSCQQKLQLTTNASLFFRLFAVLLREHPTIDDAHPVEGFQICFAVLLVLCSWRLVHAHEAQRLPTNGDVAATGGGGSVEPRLESSNPSAIHSSAGTSLGGTSRAVGHEAAGPRALAASDFDGVPAACLEALRARWAAILALAAAGPHGLRVGLDPVLTPSNPADGDALLLRFLRAERNALLGAGAAVRGRHAGRIVDAAAARLETTVRAPRGVGGAALPAAAKAGVAPPRRARGLP